MTATITGPHVPLGMLPQLPSDAGVVRVWADFAAQVLAMSEWESPLRPIGLNDLTAADLGYLSTVLSGLGGQGYCFLFAAMVGAPAQSVIEFLHDENTRVDLLSRQDVAHNAFDLDWPGKDTDDLTRLLLLNSRVIDADRERLMEEWGLPPAEFCREVSAFRRDRSLYPDWGNGAYLTPCCVLTSLVAKDSSTADGAVRNYLLAELRSPRTSNSSRRDLHNDADWDRYARLRTDGLAAGYFVAEKLTIELGADRLAWSLVLNDLDGSVTERIVAAKAALA